MHGRHFPFRSMHERVFPTCYMLSTFYFFPGKSSFWEGEGGGGGGDSVRGRGLNIVEKHFPTKNEHGTGTGCHF